MVRSTVTISLLGFIITFCSLFSVGSASKEKIQIISKPENVDTGNLVTIEGAKGNSDKQENLMNFIKNRFPTVAENGLSSSLLHLSPTRKGTTPRKYDFLAVGLEIKNGKYAAEVQDGKILLKSIPAEASEIQGLPTSPPKSEALRRETNKYVQESEAAMRAYHLSLLKYKTQLNVNALKSLVPLLEDIKKNMTQLRNSSEPDLKTYSEKSQNLDSELNLVETRIIRSRTVIQNSSNLPSTVKNKLQEVQASLVSILESQMSALLSKNPSEPLQMLVPIPDVPEDASTMTTQEIKEYLDRALHSPLNQLNADRILQFLEQITDEHRRETYDYLFGKIASKMLKQDLVSVRAVGQLLMYPQLIQQFAVSHASVQVANRIFATGKKCLLTHGATQKLVLQFSRDAQIVKTGGASNCESKDWKFHGVENGKYFLITHETREIVVGVDSSSSVTASSYDVALLSNPSYQWSIALVSCVERNCVQFINRRTGLVLTGGVSQAVKVTSQSDDSVDQKWQVNL